MPHGGWGCSAPFCGRSRNRRIVAIGTAYEAICPAVFDGDMTVICKDAIAIPAHFPSKSGTYWATRLLPIRTVVPLVRGGNRRVGMRRPIAGGWKARPFHVGLGLRRRLRSGVQHHAAWDFPPRVHPELPRVPIGGRWRLASGPNAQSRPPPNRPGDALLAVYDGHVRVGNWGWPCWGVSY